MKKMLLAINGMMLLMAGIAVAQAETLVNDQRQANQENRIDQGVASGQLNEREMNRLIKHQEHINKMEGRTKVDGVAPNLEQDRVERAQDHASRHIEREKQGRQSVRYR